MRIIFLITLFLGLQASAEGPCAKDKENFCKGVAQGEGRIFKCMKENEAKLSPECKVHWQKRKAQMKEVKEACQDDAETLCPEMSGRQAMKCLHQNKDKLSTACKAETAELRDLKKNAMEKMKKGNP